eukprot:76783-Amphidinium_carterae.1
MQKRAEGWRKLAPRSVVKRLRSYGNLREQVFWWRESSYLARCQRGCLKREAQGVCRCGTTAPFRSVQVLWFARFILAAPCVTGLAPLAARTSCLSRWGLTSSRHQARLSRELLLPRLPECSCTSGERACRAACHYQPTGKKR